MNDDRTLRVVVLPEPVPPETKRLSARLDARVQELEHLGRRRPEPDEVIDGERGLGELADGDDRARPATAAR